MKAVAVFPGRREVRLIEQPLPRRWRPTTCCCVCWTSASVALTRKSAHLKYGTPPPGEDHLVIGHEALAEVVETGSAVERLRRGDLVVPTVRRPCPDPTCLACRSGHQDFCYTGLFTERGIKEAHGYLAEYVVDRERSMVPVPSDLGDIAVLTEPLTIAEKALTQVFWLMQHRPPWLEPDSLAKGGVGDLSALVLGIGPSGSRGAMTLAVAGFRYLRGLPRGAATQPVDPSDGSDWCHLPVLAVDIVPGSGRGDR